MGAYTGLDRLPFRSVGPSHAHHWLNWCCPTSSRPDHHLQLSQSPNSPPQLLLKPQHDGLSTPFIRRSRCGPPRFHDLLKRRSSRSFRGLLSLSVTASETRLYILITDGLLQCLSDMFRHAVLLAAYLFVDQCSSTSIWHISIDEAPAPPPDKGPPLSFHALRDKSKLPYEIIGICAAYALCLVLAGVGILFGRRIRKRAAASYIAPRRRMFSPKSPVQVVEQAVDNKSSLKSPRSGRFTSWINPASRHKHQLSVQSVSTVDEKILERDRTRNEDEMAKLYAAVLVHDREKSLRSRETVNEIVEQRPPELQYLRNGTAAPNQSSYSIATTAAEDGLRSQGDTRPNSRKTKVTPLSIVPTAYDRAESTRSQLSQQGQLSARGQVISSPINFSHPISPRSPSSMTDGLPLSPRIYNPGPPPPGARICFDQHREIRGRA